MKKLLAGALLLFSAAAFAQTKDLEHEFSEFDALVVSNGFKVAVTNDPGYGAKLTVDDALENYVQCYVKGKTLYIDMDEKSVPKELKKQYKGKNAPQPVLKAVVYVPVLNSITLNDDASFSALEPIHADNFNLNLTGGTTIQNITVNAKTATLGVNKKSSLTLKVTADEIKVTGDGNASMKLDYSAGRLKVENGGSAELILNGDADKVEISTSHSAQLTLAGKSSSIEVSGKGGSSKVEASNLSVKEAVISLGGATVNVTPSDKLELDLSKGATVNFSGNPQIKLVKIQNATVTRR